MADQDTRITQKLAFFRKAQVWPVASGLDHPGWLSNFRDSELPVAIALLDFFAYFSPEMTSRIMAAEFRQLSDLTAGHEHPAAQRRVKWDDLRREVLVTYPTDERPGATDSGRTYIRKARAILGLQASQFKDPDEALQARIRQPSTPIVFLDDFAGTGNQFSDTWHRQYPLPGGGTTSYHDVKSSAPTVYIPILASSMAVREIGLKAPEVTLRPGHVLTPEYSAFHSQSLMWPEGLRHDAESVLHGASRRAGIPMGDGRQPDDWCGFGALGLAVALEDTIPDACLTLLYWERQGWKPLKRRP